MGVNITPFVTMLSVSTMIELDEDGKIKREEREQPEWLRCFDDQVGGASSPVLTVRKLKT